MGVVTLPPSIISLKNKIKNKQIDKKSSGCLRFDFYIIHNRPFIKNLFPLHTSSLLYLQNLPLCLLLYLSPLCFVFSTTYSKRSKIFRQNLPESWNIETENLMIGNRWLRFSPKSCSLGSRLNLLSAVEPISFNLSPSSSSTGFTTFHELLNYSKSNP